MLLIRIIEKLLIIYFAAYLLIDIWLYLAALGVFARRKKSDSLHNAAAGSEPRVSVVVPAYNEEVSVVVCTRMLLDLNYSNYQVIVVNDGSSDNTFGEMMSGFEWERVDIKHNTTESIQTAEVRQVWSAAGGKLLLIDKENGGKADAINTAINIANGEYICTIDADSILDREALQRVLAPMVANKAVFVSGGQLALSNDLIIRNNRVVSARMPRNIWVLWQILEYISTFMVARVSLSRINALLIMSGAFSMFRRADLQSVGGFLTKINQHAYILQTLGPGKHTITEDMEIVTRLWKYYRDQHKKARAVFVPGPVCWTEAPEKPRQLYKQRMRWHQGLAETLWLYRGMMFEPRYRMTGMVALPYYVFMELFAPAIKLFSLFFVSALVISGELNQQWVLLMLAGTILITTIIMSTITVFIENWSLRQSAVSRDALRYKHFTDWITLLFSGILSNFIYSFYRMAAQLHGIVQFFRKREEWNKLERKGVKVETNE
jgi:cellulose synthase/poly-beta-1,6-N-acetylglucosamine synthase-like glycosyltransferase